MTLLLRFPVLLVVLAVGGCAMREPAVELNDIYRGHAQLEGPDRNPVIVIPGTLGSRLRDEATGTIAWGGFGQGFARPGKDEGNRMIALPMRQGVTLADLRDEVVPDGALDTLRVSLAPGIRIEAKAYLQILEALGAGGYRDEQLGESGALEYAEDHYTCFQFAYDWRRSNVENAALLHDFILEKKRFVEQENLKRFGRTGDVRFDIVAHSMGGLIARYYLRYGNQPLRQNGGPVLNWAGARHVDKVQIVASPSAGSIRALQQLLQGVDYGPAFPAYPVALIGTMPSVYELLPRARHRILWEDGDESRKPLDPLDIRLWEYWEWGLLNREQDAVLAGLLPGVEDAETRREVAWDHLMKCLDNARRFQEAMDRPGDPPEHVQLNLFVGDGRWTAAGAAITGYAIRIDESVPGDGTVARYSALLDENFSRRPEALLLKTPIGWHDVDFLFAEHLELTKDTNFINTLLFQLLQEGG